MSNLEVDERTQAEAEETPAGLGCSLLARLRRRLDKALPADSLRKRFARGAAWSMLGTVVAQGLAMLASIVRARILGQTGFGELGMIQSTIGMFGVFAGMGLSMTGTKFVAEYRVKDPARAGRIISLTSTVAFGSGGLIALVAWLACPYLATQVMKAPHLVFELRLGCLLLFLNAINGSQTGVLAGFEAFKTIAITNLFIGIMNFTLGVGGVYLWGLRGAVEGLVGGMACAWAINHLALRWEIRKARIPVTWGRVRGEMGILWRFSLPALISAAMFVPASWVLNAMLVNQPKGYGELGLFNATQQCQQLILFLPALISQITLPMLANLWGEKKFNQYSRLLMINIGLFSGLALALALPLALAAPLVMKIYGKGFSSGGPVLVLVCATSVLWSLLIPVGQAIWSIGAVKTGMALTAVRFLLLVGLFKLFLARGALGLALAYLVTYIVQAAYLVPYLWWKTRQQLARNGEGQGQTAGAIVVGEEALQE